MKIKFAIIIFAFTAMTKIISAQTELKPGYILNLQNDTIWGKGNISKNQKYCLFQPHNEADYIKYTADRISGFRILKGRFYISQQVNEKWIFLEYLIDGELDLYVLRVNGVDRFFIKKNDMPLKEIVYNNKEIIYKDGNQYANNDKRYLGLIKAYMKDSPEMYNKIDNIQEIKQKSLIELAEDYHNSICLDKECINYSKTIPKIRLKLEPFTGLNYHNNFYSPQCGFLLNIWRPLNNERLYFKVGLSYSSLPYLTRSNSSYNGNGYKIKVPFYWQYVFGNKNIKPTLGIGFVNGNLEASIQSGIIFSLSDNFELTANGSFDSMLKFVADYHKEYYNNSFGHSIMIGCQIKIR